MSKTTVVIKKGKDREVIRDGRLSSAIQRAFNLYQRGRAVEQEMSGAKGFIAQRARDFIGAGGTVSFQAGGVTCRFRSRHETVIPEENIKEVRRLLGKRFTELVKVQKKYMGSRDLIDDSRIRKLVTVKELSPQFTWEGVTDPFNSEL